MTTTLWSGAQTAVSARTGGRRWWRIALVAAIVIGAALLLGRSGQAVGSTAAYHPNNPTAGGSQAIARVLAARGVEVIVAEGEGALLHAPIDGDTTVVVTNTSDLREDTVASLIHAAGKAERLVLVRPERRVVRAIAPTVSMEEAPHGQDALISTCDTADVHRDDRLTRSQSQYRDSRAVSSCFVNDGYAVYLTTSAAGLSDLVLIGSTDTISNARTAQSDNGAVALRALGHSARVVWYVPDLRDVPPSSAAQTESFTPRWWGPMLLLLLFTALAAFWWRGRRFGRLVVEPLPVVVRAIETTESRGRMYHKARDSARAGAVLRDASRRRLAAYLGLAKSTPPDLLAEAVASATGRQLNEIRWLLDESLPQTDPALLDLAARLAALEKEIRRS